MCWLKRNLVKFKRSATAVESAFYQLERNISSVARACLELHTTTCSEVSTIICKIAVKGTFEKRLNDVLDWLPEKASKICQSSATLNDLYT